MDTTIFLVLLPCYSHTKMRIFSKFGGLNDIILRCISFRLILELLICGRKTMKEILAILRIALETIVVLVFFIVTILKAFGFVQFCLFLCKLTIRWEIAEGGYSGLLFVQFITDLDVRNGLCFNLTGFGHFIFRFPLLTQLIFLHQCNCRYFSDASFF